ncbi:hypothetical protein [Inquilinus limosus]|uniref:hypothetical protein n=1 Tax=Inquilinus limosus TaxID=171674 RepID=UPI003F167EC2
MSFLGAAVASLANPFIERAAPAPERRASGLVDLDDRELAEIGIRRGAIESMKGRSV